MSGRGKFLNRGEKGCTENSIQTISEMKTMLLVKIKLIVLSSFSSIAVLGNVLFFCFFVCSFLSLFFFCLLLVQQLFVCLVVIVHCFIGSQQLGSKLIYKINSQYSSWFRMVRQALPGRKKTDRYHEAFRCQFCCLTVGQEKKNKKKEKSIRKEGAHKMDNDPPS